MTRPTALVTCGRAGSQVTCRSLQRFHPGIAGEVLFDLEDRPASHKIKVLERYESFAMVSLVHMHVMDLEVREYLYAKWDLLYLTRDLFWREMSAAVANHIGVWHTKEKQLVEPFEIDIPKFIYGLNYHEEQDTHWRTVISEQLYYEELQKSWNSYIRAVQALLKLPILDIPPALVKSYDYDPSLILNREQLADALIKNGHGAYSWSLSVNNRK